MELVGVLKEGDAEKGKHIGDPKFSSSRKTHVHTAIERMDGAYQKPFKKHYDLLCEMIHPSLSDNAGNTISIHVSISS